MMRYVMELKGEIMRDVEDEMFRMFPTYHTLFPESFLDEVIEDVYETSAWQSSGYYSSADISIAIQRTVLRALGKDM